jgi:hypothetical protein
MSRKFIAVGGTPQQHIFVPQRAMSVTATEGGKKKKKKNQNKAQPKPQE